MYHGKYLKPKPVRSAKRNGLLLISLVLLLTIAVGGSIAFLIDITNQVENTFTPANVNVEIKEDFENNIKKNVYIHNTSNTKVYVRVTLAEYWQNAAGEIIPPPADPTFVWGDWTISDNPDWFQVGQIYYYTLPLDPNSEAYATDDTSKLIDQVTVTLPEGYTYHLDIFAEAIQADPSTAVKNAWTDVDVDANGSLKPHTAG